MELPWGHQEALKLDTVNTDQVLRTDIEKVDVAR